MTPTGPSDEAADEVLERRAREVEQASSALGRRLVVAVLLGVLVYGVLVVVRGASAISAELARFAWLSFAGACALSLVNYGLRFLKWGYYLRVLDVRGVPKWESFACFLSGFVLTVTPGKIGEVFKSYVLYRLRGVPMVRTAPVVVAERVTDLLGIIVLITLGGATFPGGLVWAALGATAVAFLLTIIASPKVAKALLSPWPRLPGVAGRVAAHVVPKVEQGLASLRTLTAPRHLVVPSLLSIVGWGLEGVGTWWVLQGFGAGLDLPKAAFSYATATLAGALVPVPGGLGVTEKILEESMVRLGGVPGAVATASMLLTRLATLWFAVLVGFAALFALQLLRPGLLGARPVPTPAEPSGDKS
jgi:uncharacterized protein (TIRG00374 family)